MRDMIKAILRIVFEAPETTPCSLKAQQLIACHEAGHTLVAELLEPGSVDLVTILTHDSQTAGITSLHRDEDYFRSKELMEVRVMCLLGGKAATEICHGAVDTGTIVDLRRAFDIVHRFVDDYCAYGFDKFVYSQTVSQDLLGRRDSLVAAEMERYYARTRKLLIDNRDKLDMMTHRLLQEKTLLGDQIQAIAHSA